MIVTDLWPWFEVSLGGQKHYKDPPLRVRKGWFWFNPMRFWFLCNLIHFNTRNIFECGLLNVRISMYFSVAFCNLLSIRACTSCYFFTLCFLHVFDLVYDVSEFIFLCYGHCFRHSPNASSKVGVEFIRVVLYIDGLSLFFIFHQTQRYRL